MNLRTTAPCLKDANRQSQGGGQADSRCEEKTDPPTPASNAFRSSAAFGKRIEYWIIGLLLKDGFDVFVPLVDDDGIDAIIRHRNGRKIDLQIKARSRTVGFGAAALFAALTHDNVREGYFFLFYSERLDAIWLMSSNDFIRESTQNKTGRNAGKRAVWFNGRSSVKKTEHCYPRFDRWKISHDGKHDFRRIAAFLEKGVDPA